MNEKIIENWNSVVKSNDNVYSLGDFGFSQYTRLRSVIKRLNGNLNLINGNHDKVIIQNKQSILKDCPNVKQITDYKEIYIDKQFICMFHYATRTWNKSHYGSWFLFGHTHGILPPLGKSVDVGVDSPYILGYAPYRPFSFNEVKNFMDKQDIHQKF
jgi:calcineurin-like phosphoesterase family protein